MPSTDRHPEPRHPASRDSTLSEAALLGRYQELRRKLSSAQPVWHSGRLDRLGEALRSLEEEVQRRRLAVQ